MPFGILNINQIWNSEIVDCGGKCLLRYAGAYIPTFQKNLIISSSFVLRHRYMYIDYIAPRSRRQLVTFNRNVFQMRFSLSRYSSLALWCCCVCIVLVIQIHCCRDNHVSAMTLHEVSTCFIYFKHSPSLKILQKMAVVLDQKVIYCVLWTYWCISQERNVTWLKGVGVQTFRL